MLISWSIILKSRKHTAPPLGIFYAKIVAMDKIIKTISESGAFRAFVLDSTETVRTAQEKLKPKPAQL